jgi:hypothetical protein
MMIDSAPCTLTAKLGASEMDKARREITPKAIAKVNFPFLFMDKFPKKICIHIINALPVLQIPRFLFLVILYGILPYFFMVPKRWSLTII